MSRKNGWIGVASPFNAPLYPTPHRLLRFPREIVTWNMDMFSSEVFTLSKAKEPSRTCQKSSALTCHLGFCICACTRNSNNHSKKVIYFVCFYTQKSSESKCGFLVWRRLSFRNSLSSHYNCILTFLSLELGMRQKINLHYKKFTDNDRWRHHKTIPVSLEIHFLAKIFVKPL